jgi:TetR/AcrR family transcriptional regulator
VRPARLTAERRREAIVEAALRVFATRSYGGATTAEIAREAGVSEPILYRHFASKRELYLTCLEEAWTRLRAAVEEKLEELGPAYGPLAIAKTGLGLREKRMLPPTLWVEALSVAPEDPELRRYLRRHIREVHDYLAGVLRSSQEAGGVAPDRDPDAEAWIFIAGALLVLVGDRLGGVLTHDDFAAIATQRFKWLFDRHPELPLLTPN